MINPHAGQTVSRHVKTRGLEVTWRGQSAGTPQKPVKCVMKAGIVVGYRHWRRHMKDIG